jgi:hypothetical protein
MSGVLGISEVVLMDFHATVIEVLLIAGVGAYIGFLIGLRSGVFLAASKKTKGRARKSPAASSAKNRAKEPGRPTVS